MAITNDTADDWLNWVEREDITLKVRLDPSASTSDTFTSHSLTASGGAAKRRAIKRSEIIAGMGRFTGSNIVWLIPKANLPSGVTIKNGYQVVDGAGQEYDIQEVIVGKYGQTFRCIAILV